MKLEKKISTVIGARPQFVKAAALSKALLKAGIEESLIHTGQHYDANMSGIFFDELEIPKPDYELHVGSLPHGAQTGRMLEGLENIWTKEKPDAVMVLGDTNSTLAGALAAVKLRIPVIHVEAGLRSHDAFMPEEINRVLTDHIARLLFAPTDTAVKNLVQEGVPQDRIRRSGDVMYDIALSQKEVSTLTLPKRFVLLTVHRAENTDDREKLKVIVDAFIHLSHDIDVIWPIHPRTKKVLENLGAKMPKGIHFWDPVGYREMLTLEKKAALVATDSGGVQKEAFFHGVPSLVLRETTEWLEILDLGWATLAPPTSIESIVKAARDSMGKKGRPGKPFGDGHAAHQIASDIAKFLGEL